MCCFIRVSMRSHALLIFVVVCDACWRSVVCETVGCDITAVTLESHKTYLFEDCFNWNDGNMSSVPVLSASSLVNVTVSIVRCSLLPVLSISCSTGLPSDQIQGSEGLYVVVQDVTMDVRKPMDLVRGCGELRTRWTVGGCAPTVSISIRDSVLFIDASGVTPVNHLLHFASPFLHVEVSNVNVRLVMENVSITAHTNFAQSLIAFSCWNEVVLPSFVYVSMHAVSVEMIGRSLNYSQMASADDKRILQTVLEFETTYIALENISIFMSGDCSFRVHFGLDTLNVHSLSSDALNTSYYAFVVHAQSQATSLGVTLRNFSLVLSDLGSYHSELQGSQYVSMIMLEECRGLTNTSIVLRNLVVHHRVTLFIEIRADDISGRYGAVVIINSLTSKYVNIIIHNITARIEGYSGMPAGLTPSTLMPGVLATMISLALNWTFGTIDVRHAVAVLSLVNGSAPSIPLVQVDPRFNVTYSTILLSENSLVSHAGIVFTTTSLLLSLNVFTGLIGLSGNCTNISITVINSDILLASYSCSAISAVLQLNMTCIVSLANMGTAASAATPALAGFRLTASYLNYVNNATVQMFNTSVRRATTGLQAAGTDFRGHLIIPPTVTNASVEILNPIQASSHTIICPMTVCSLSISSVVVSYASGLGSFIAAANTLRIYSSIFNISRSSLVSPKDQQLSVVGTTSSNSNGLVTGGDGSQMFFVASNFSGFNQLVRGLPASQCTNTKADRLTIDCIVWDNGAIPKHSIPSPTSCLVVQRPFGAGCPYLAPVSTPSQSVSIMADANTTGPTPAPLVSTSTAAVVTAVTTVSTLLSLASAAGPLAQSLIIVGQSQCAPQAVQESTKDGRFLLSPFYALGDHGIVYGNIGLFGLLVGMQLIAVQFFKWRDGRAASPEPEPQREKLFLPHTAVVPSLRVAPYMPPEARARFPNLSILAAGLALQGTSSTSLRMVFSGDAASTVTGAVGLCCVGAALVVWRRLERCAVARSMRFKRYRLHALRRSWHPLFALPVGRWGSDVATATHGKLRSSVREGAEWLGSYTSVYAFVVNTFSALPVPGRWCLGVWIPLSLVSLGCLFVVVRHRPARVPLVDVFNAGCLASSAVLQVVSSVVAEQESTGAGSSFAGATTVLLVCTLVYSGFTVLRGLHAIVVFLWERQQRAEEPASALALTDAPTLQGMFDRVSSKNERMHIRQERLSIINSAEDSVSSGRIPLLDDLFLLPELDVMEHRVRHLHAEKSTVRRSVHSVGWNQLIVPPLTARDVADNLEQ
ncbi:membrane-associated protein, putative, partial [Bodo saltans]